ncbi:sugar transferase [Sedimentitalea todarodis]|uniref:Sugar transferase n=1 Tax=Sedimentitalea todarodis TaxID=1631240 RepID=A0ABU3VFX8_9RHOB|nr:sugar transferase [Sedimentitalea todarodis]MDU9005082.1 sugar transferase [Sedimentitalea todarodis]
MQDRFDMRMATPALCSVKERGFSQKDLLMSSKAAFVYGPISGGLRRAASAQRGRVVRSSNAYLNWGKRTLDVALVVMSMPVVLPLVLLFAVLLWFEGGSPFYRQARIGKNGKEFLMLKLRSMVMDADARLARVLENDQDLRAEWETTQKLRNDPRVTPLGALLRQTSLDELPQLWNVLIGEMSLVGPRPMMPEQLALYGDPADYEALLPGLTGIWQVSTRNESHFSHRAVIDAEYRKTVSLKTDVTLLFKTISVVLRRTGC